MLIIEIALGIVLAVLILRYWTFIVTFGFFGILLLIVIGLLIVLLLLTIRFPWYGLGVVFVILFLWLDDRLIDKHIKNRWVKKRKEVDCAD